MPAADADQHAADRTMRRALPSVAAGIPGFGAADHRVSGCEYAAVGNGAVLSRPNGQPRQTTVGALMSNQFCPPAKASSWPDHRVAERHWRGLPAAWNSDADSRHSKPTATTLGGVVSNWRGASVFACN